VAAYIVHNWINIYMEEKAGRLDYKGYIKPRRRGRGRGGPRDDNSEEQVHTLQFEWHGVYKEMGTSIIARFSKNF
jgi:poly(U)-specific endoribonuclease